MARIELPDLSQAISLLSNTTADTMHQLTLTLRTSLGNVTDSLTVVFDGLQSVIGSVEAFLPMSINRTVASVHQSIELNSPRVNSALFASTLLIYALVGLVLVCTVYRLAQLIVFIIEKHHSIVHANYRKTDERED